MPVERTLKVRYAMHVVLLVLTVWCALSVLFAAAHCRLCRYAGAAGSGMDMGRRARTLVAGGFETEPLGSDVADFFASYARR